jgi:parallel beta-helix repeat protein
MNSVAAIDFDGVNNNLNMINNNIILGNNYGIDIDVSMSNRIEDNVLSENGLAISIGSSLETLLLRNTIQNSSAGIYFDHSFGNRLSENIIQNASNFGLYFLSSNGNDLEKNHLENCGLLVYGDTPAEYYNDVDTSNTINGKPIYYLIKQIGSTVPQDAGAVILVNSSDCIIKNLDLSSGTVGITLAYSSHNIIQENLIEDESWTGIDLSSGSNDNNMIQRNTIQRNSFGIDIEYCTGNTLKYNLITSNSCGILLYNTIETIIRRNTIVQNSIGIDAVQTDNDTIRWNNIFLNSLYGLSVDGCSVTALWNWWGSVKGPVVDEDGNGDHLNTIRDGQILYAPWHRLPVLFSGILRFIFTINQDKNSINKQFITPERTSNELSQSSSVDFTVHGMKTIRIEQGQNVLSKSPLEKNFLE